MAAKLPVICLLIAIGLACSPPLVETLKCYQCSGNMHQCTGANEAEAECSAGQVCAIGKAVGKLAKSCEQKNGEEYQKFECLQRELRQRGNCVRGSALQFYLAARKCGIEIPRASEGKWLSLLDLGWNNTEAGHEAGQPRQGGSFAACVCTTDLCNTQAFLDSGKEGGSATTEVGDSGSGVTGRLEGTGMTLASAIFAVVISWFHV